MKEATDSFHDTFIPILSLPSGKDVKIFYMEKPIGEGGTLKYLSTYQLWSKDFAVSEEQWQNFILGWNYWAGWSGKGCGGL